LQRQLGWWATKRAMTREKRAMAMATKRVVAKNGDNAGNGYGKEGGEQATAVTIALEMGTAQRIWSIVLQLARGG
jgi:hypothetical protein